MAANTDKSGAQLESKLNHFYTTSSVALTPIKVLGRPGVSTPIIVLSSVFGMGELVRWLSNPPEPLATQTHEPKMKVTPLGGVMVLKAKVAIELAESPTWRASCRCLPPSLLRDTLSSRALELDGARSTKI